MCQLSWNTKENPVAVRRIPAGLLYVPKEKHSIDRSSHSESLCWWETEGRRVKGTWPCYSRDRRVQDELIVVVEWRKFWPLRVYLPSILTDVAGFLWIHPSSKWRFSSVQPVTGPESHLMVLQGRLEIKLLIHLKVNICAGKRLPNKQQTEWPLDCCTGAL